MALIGLGEYLKRVIHYIFAKKPTNDRTIDRLWETAGTGLDEARTNIVRGADQMHPGRASGAYLDRHAANLGGLSRLPGESDAALAARLGGGFDFWRAVGATAFFECYGPLLACPIGVARHPSRPFCRLLTLGGVPTDEQRLYADLHKFRPAHYIFNYLLGPGLEWRRFDTGWTFDGAARFNTITGVI
jgi:hypothetical protein